MMDIVALPSRGEMSGAAHGNDSAEGSHDGSQRHKPRLR